MAIHNQEELPGTWELLDGDGLVLSPSPTDSPNDPLNWHWARKAWNGFLCVYLVGLTAATSNDAGAGQTGMESQLGISYSYANTASGVLFAAIGLFAFISAPLPSLVGRKSLYIICMLSGLGGSVWYAVTQTPGDSIWNQMFVGASESCAEANVQLSLTDMYFEHQLGSVLGVYMVATSFGTYVGPLIASFIADSYQGWRWIGWWAVIISGGTILVLVFGMEETAFDRILPEDRKEMQQSEQHAAITENGAQASEGAAPASEEDDEEKKYPQSNDEVTPTVLESGALVPESGSRAHEPKKTYWQRIQLITPASNLRGIGFKQYIQRFLLLFRMLFFPAVLFSGLQWGAQDAWLSFYLTLEEDDWTDAPWNYGDVASGLMNIPCLIGAMIGCLYAGPINDRFCIWVARRRGGRREAEDRLWFLIPTAFISFTGMLIFGIATGRGWTRWGAPYFALGLIGFGFAATGDIAMSSTAEAYPDAIIEGMACIALINNGMACGFTFAVGPWLDSAGIENGMIACAVLDLFFILLTIPFLYYGKTFRMWTKHAYLDFINKRDAI